MFAATKNKLHSRVCVLGAKITLRLRRRDLRFKVGLVACGNALIIIMKFSGLRKRH